LVGLALLAASGRGDIRDIAGPSIRQPQAKGMIGRFIAAVKGGY
jgi:cell division protein FtsA